MIKTCNIFQIIKCENTACIGHSMEPRPNCYVKFSKSFSAFTGDGENVPLYFHATKKIHLSYRSNILMQRYGLLLDKESRH